MPGDVERVAAGSGAGDGGADLARRRAGRRRPAPRGPCSRGRRAGRSPRRGSTGCPSGSPRSPGGVVDVEPAEVLVAVGRGRGRPRRGCGRRRCCRRDAALKLGREAGAARPGTAAPSGPWSRVKNWVALCSASAASHGVKCFRPGRCRTGSASPAGRARSRRRAGRTRSAGSAAGSGRRTSSWPVCGSG